MRGSLTPKGQTLVISLGSGGASAAELDHQPKNEHIFLLLSDTQSLSHHY